MTHDAFAVSPEKVVLDSNVVLGWLLFNDEACSAIGRAVASGSVLWLVNDALRNELAHVLLRGIRNWPCDPLLIMARFDQHATPVGSVPQTSPVISRGLLCTDRDDQKFIDLAIDIGASALLTRDRAVLRLAKRAQAHSLAIVEPEDWLVATRKRAAEAAL